MNPNQFTLKLQEALQEAQSLTMQKQHVELSPQHLLLALLEQEDGITLPILSRIGVEHSQLKSAIQERLSSEPQVKGVQSTPSMSRELSALYHMISYAGIIS